MTGVRNRLIAVRTRGGVTLLELILALSLMAIISGLIVQAISLHVRALDARRNYAEEAQLVHAILAQIARDLQNVPVRHPIDISSVEAMMSDTDVSSALEGLGEDAPDALGEAPEDADVGDLLELSEENPNTTNIADAETIPEEPGLYGNQYELQIDVSRLPRIDEYQQQVSAIPGVLGDIPSEIKTVAYYVRSTGPSAGISGSMGTNGPGTTATLDPLGGTMKTGLIRRSLSRAVMQWNAQSGSTMSLDPYEEVWAPEVLAIEFHYFDGTDWVYEWDSSAQGMPIAVEILLTIQPRPTNTSSSVLPGSSPATSVPRVYRRVVQLPQAAPVDAQGESSEMEALGL